MLESKPDLMWELGAQMGVTAAVTSLRRGEGDREPPWEYMQLLHSKERFASAGYRLLVIEGNPVPMDRIRLGLPGRDEEIEVFCTLVRAMGALGIPILCYNFMARIPWLRTSMTERTRGGALVTGFDNSLVEKAPLTEAGRVPEARIWEAFEYFIGRVVPVAEEAGVKLALHPDDPPLSPIRGIGRIFKDVDAFERAVAMAPSPFNGIAFCQGNFAAMGVDIPSTVRRLAPHIHFAHFRDIRGDARRFVETFHDDGQTDMVAAMAAYREIGFKGPIRPDHAPTMAGEPNDRPGYERLGRLFAVGYMKGLMQALDRPGTRPRA